MQYRIQKGTKTNHCGVEFRAQYSSETIHVCKRFKNHPGHHYCFNVDWEEGSPPCSAQSYNTAKYNAKRKLKNAMD